MSNVSSQSMSNGRTDKRATRSAGMNKQDVKITRATLVVAVIPHPAREQLIREAAYHHAEARGFEPGHELDDWLVAEAEVDERLSGEGRAY